MDCRAPREHSADRPWRIFRGQGLTPPLRTDWLVFRRRDALLGWLVWRYGGVDAARAPLVAYERATKARGERFCRPPRGKTYIAKRATAMTAAAIATMATVETATTTWETYPPRAPAKPQVAATTSIVIGSSPIRLRWTVRLPGCVKRLPIFNPPPRARRPSAA